MSYSSKIVRFFMTLSLLALFSKVTLSFFLGTAHCYISGLSWLTPVLALIAGSSTGGLLILFFALKYLFFKRATTAGIPTLCATYSYYAATQQQLSWRDYALNFFFPVLAVAVFVFAQGFSLGSFYALYWLIPATLFILRFFGFCHEPWAYALTSSFIAHAAGSLIWLALVPMSSEQWFLLIPLVAAERLVIHCGQLLLLRTTQYLSELFARIATTYQFYFSS